MIFSEEEMKNEEILSKKLVNKNTKIAVSS